MFLRHPFICFQTRQNLEWCHLFMSSDKVVSVFRLWCINTYCETKIYCIGIYALLTVGGLAVSLWFKEMKTSHALSPLTPSYTWWYRRYRENCLECMYCRFYNVWRAKNISGQMMDIAFRNWFLLVKTKKRERREKVSVYPSSRRLSIMAESTKA